MHSSREKKNTLSLKRLQLYTPTYILELKVHHFKKNSFKKKYTNSCHNKSENFLLFYLSIILSFSVIN